MLTPCGAAWQTGLVHRSPEKRYHANGRVVNRLVLKVDVGGPSEGPTGGAQVVQGRVVL